MISSGGALSLLNLIARQDRSIPISIDPSVECSRYISPTPISHSSNRTLKKRESFKADKVYFLIEPPAPTPPPPTDDSNYAYTKNE